MHIRLDRSSTGTTRRRWSPALAVSLFSLAVVPSLYAQGAAPPPVSLGAGLRTSFFGDFPDGGDKTAQMLLNSARLYINGTAAPKTKFTFNTEYSGASNNVIIMDAVGQYELSKNANIWVGRFLPPSDRANLYGPYYAHHWGVYTDGVQDGYPTVAVGRDNGVMYWSQFDKAKVSFGVFDGASLTGKTTPLTAGRVQLDFWDAEDGYYQNSTYYGDKNLLAVAGAFQVQGTDQSAYSADFLLEKKVSTGGAFTVEAEWANYDQLGGYNSNYGTDKGGYVLVSYLFPKPSGVGKWEVLGKFGTARFRDGKTALDADYNQKTTEFNLNYVIKQFNSRLMIFYQDLHFDAVRANNKQFGIGMQIQM